MSITQALSNSLTGLSAAGRMAETVSNNVANALTEGYARREVDLASADLVGRGAGVSIAGIVRASDPAIAAERRQADAALALGAALADSQSTLAGLLGPIGATDSLAARVDGFGLALTALADAPDSTERQASAVAAGAALATTLNSISTETARVRLEADAEIARQVRVVNDNLSKIEALGREIQMLAAGGRDISALKDQRQRLVDEVASIIPIKSVRREGEQLALISNDGAVLMDGGYVAEISFSPTAAFGHEQTFAAGDLSDLGISGVEVTPGGGAPSLSGGSLEALFAVRDDLAPRFNAGIDGLARDLVERFEAAGLDPTRAPGDPGLFTDDGAAFDPAAELGLAGRIALNAAVDPDQGGEIHRIRDGLGALLPGEAGDGSIPRALAEALRAPETPPAGTGVTNVLGAAALAAELTVLGFGNAARAEATATERRAASETLAAEDARATGVDTDQELQRLLLIEQAYAANARVIETVDSLVRRLLEI